MPNNINIPDLFLLNRPASDDGTKAGNLQPVGDYSDAGLGETDFYIEALQGEKIAVYRLIVHVVDSGSFDSGSYGNGISLTNGIRFIYEKDGVQLDISDGFPIITNVDWGRYCYDISVSTFGQGPEALNARWTFEKHGAPVTLNEGDKLILRFNDDFSGLIDHSFVFQGVHLGQPNALWTVLA